MNSNLKKIITYVSVTIILLIMYKFLIINQYFTTDTYSSNYFIVELVSRIIFIGITIGLIQKNSINLKIFNANKILTGIVIIILLYLLYQNVLSESITYNKSVNFTRLSLYSLMNLSIGFFEELFIRVLIFILVCRYFEYKKLFLAVVVTAFIFSLLHFQNIFIEGNILSDVILQMIFAFGVGLVFQLIMIKTRNLYLLAFIHATIDFNAGLKYKFFNVLPDDINTNVADNTIEISNSLAIIVYLVYLSPIIVGIYFYLRNKNILNYLDIKPKP